MVLFLWLNKGLWDVKSIQKCAIHNDTVDENVEMYREEIDLELDDQVDHTLSDIET